MAKYTYKPKRISASLSRWIQISSGKAGGTPLELFDLHKSMTWSFLQSYLAPLFELRDLFHRFEKILGRFNMSKFVQKFIKSKFIRENPIGVVGGVLGAGLFGLSAYSYVTDTKAAYYIEELRKAHSVVMDRRRDEIVSNILECDVVKEALHNKKYKLAGSMLIVIPLVEEDQEKRGEEADPDTPVDLPKVEDKNDVIPNELSVDSEVVKRDSA